MSEKIENGRNKRSIQGIFVRPKRQISITIAILSTGIMLMALLMGYLIFKLGEVIEALKDSAPQAAAFVQSSVDPVLDVLILCHLLFWLLAFVVGVIVTQRIFGPIVPIMRHIKNLEDGNYASRVTLRKGDNLEEIAGALNILAEKLAQKP